MHCRAIKLGNYNQAPTNFLPQIFADDRRFLDSSLFLSPFCTRKQQPCDHYRKKDSFIVLVICGALRKSAVNDYFLPSLTALGWLPFLLVLIIRNEVLIINWWRKI